MQQNPLVETVGMKRLIIASSNWQLEPQSVHLPPQLDETDIACTCCHHGNHRVVVFYIAPGVTIGGNRLRISHRAGIASRRSMS